jgi:hypothetical protein
VEKMRKERNKCLGGRGRREEENKGEREKEEVKKQSKEQMSTEELQPRKNVVMLFRQ